MTDFPRIAVPPLFLNSYSMYTAIPELRTATGSQTLASATWIAANTAVYMPIWIPWDYPVNRVFWVNGSAAGGNTDFGIYSFDGGARLFSTGSTASTGNSVPQYVTPGTPLLLSPGRYYFAMSHSTTATNEVLAGSIPSIAALRGSGVLYEASAFPLPATMTPVAVSGNRRYPLCGITLTSSGF